MTGTDTDRDPLPVVLAGGHGFGAVHLRNLGRLAAAGLVRLVGVCDPVPLTAADLDGHGPVPQGADLAALLARARPAITIVSTPVHTHLPLARTALEHGSHVHVEKPPTPSLAGFRELAAAVERSGRACQVGFQSLGSDALGAVRALVADGAIGAVRGIGGLAAWTRGSNYFARAAWAGRRTLDGTDVVDGALTNPLAHAVATALALAGAEHAPVGDVELELFRAHDIESDDTSCVRLRTPDGTPVTVAATLCAPEQHPPRILVHGEAGRITLWYTRDEVLLERPGRTPERRTHPRTDLLENLVAHLREGAPLLVPPPRAEGFMSVLEAVRRAPDPRPIPADAQRVSSGEGGQYRTVAGVTELVERSAAELALFSELGAPWVRAATR